MNMQTSVSIRARHHWRAIRWLDLSGTPKGWGFNPRPPSLAGDPKDVAEAERDQRVSIRARHHWRAIRGGLLPCCS